MKSQSRISLVGGVVSPFILFVSLVSLPIARTGWVTATMFPESENTFEFTNGETEDASDLHIHWSRAVKVKQVKPFKKKEGSGTSRTDLSNGVVKPAGKASVTVSWDGSGEPEVKEWWWTKNNGDRLGDIKTGNPTTASVPGAASSSAASRAVAAYTGDWQPGDEVSFSFSGNVYGPSGEKQTQDDYTDHLVGIVDSQGNKTEIPWSKVIRYKVAEGATSVTASLMKRDRTIITTAKIPVHPKRTPLPIQLPPKITGNSVAYPVSQIGQPYTVYAPNGGFSGDANKIKLRTRNKIDNATTGSNAVAASPHSALFNPQVREPGSYEYEVTDEGRFKDSFEVSAVGIKLDTSRAYRTNQEGTLAIVVALPPYVAAQQKLLSEDFQVTIEMETPNVLAFSNGQNPVVWSLQSNEVANNQGRKEFSVRAGAPGTFTITARAKTPLCNNPSVTKGATETVAIDRPPDAWRKLVVSSVIPDRVALRSSLPPSEQLVPSPQPGQPTRCFLYIEGENFPEHAGVTIQPDRGVQKVHATRLDSQNLIVELVLASGTPLGKKEIVFFDQQKPSAQVTTEKSVNLYASLTPEEEKKLDGQILRNKWNKYKKLKHTNRAIAAGYMASLMRELNLLPPNVTPPEGSDPVSWWDQVLFGAKTAAKAGAEDVAHMPVPIDTLEAIQGLAETLAALYGDPNTEGGAHGLRKQLGSRGLSDDEIGEINDEIAEVYKGLRQRAGR